MSITGTNTTNTTCANMSNSSKSFPSQSVSKIIPVLNSHKHSTSSKHYRTHSHNTMGGSNIQSGTHIRPITSSRPSTMSTAMSRSSSLPAMYGNNSTSAPHSGNKIHTIPVLTQQRTNSVRNIPSSQPTPPYSSQSQVTDCNTGYVLILTIIQLLMSDYYYFVYFFEYFNTVCASQSFYI